MPSVLIVDDSPDKREALVELLALHRPHLAISEADNGLKGLVAARANTPDLILLDIDMPVKNGYECLIELKEDSNLKHVPVLIISGKESREHGVLQAIEKGADDYFGMPVENQLKVLLARIDSALKRREQQLRATRLREQLEQTVMQIDEESKRRIRVLEAVFPKSCVPELETSGRIPARRYDGVAVLFCDVVGFTAFCDGHSPEEIVEPLEWVTEEFERQVDHYGLEKIKMIGDALLAVAGFQFGPKAGQDDTPERIAAREAESVRRATECGFALMEAAAKSSAGWKLRVGVHSGPVVAGKMGRRKYCFDVWGDTVNTASRIQGAAEPGSVVLSDRAWGLVAGDCQGKSLGRIELKNKKDGLELWRVDRVVAPKFGWE
jgi:adenylate cyclase